MSWKGQYEQNGAWHAMDLQKFDAKPQPGGIISGQGKDQVGDFEFKGGFSPNGPQFRFIKQYIGQHAIYYEGTADLNARTMNGHWGFQPGNNDGQFKIEFK